MPNLDEELATASAQASPSTEDRVRFADMIVNDAVAAELDPLGADDFFANTFPWLSEEGRMAELAELASDLVPKAATIARYTVPEAQAATRDLAMIASALQRWHEPFSIVGGLEEALLRLSALTFEPPADTVYSYGPRNPRGDRTRRYTTHKSEDVFIESFRAGMLNLPHALDLVMTAHGLSIFDRGYVQALRTADDFLVQMVDAIVTVRRHVTPEFFTSVMRPFFDAKTVGGRVYLAPGGAHMPVIILDQLLWAIGLQDPVYVAYFFENLEYQPPYVRELAIRMAEQPSLITQACEATAGLPSLPAQAGSSLRALERLLTTLSKFRMPHLVVAKANFALRGDTDVGSGGYQPDILEYLIDRIRDGRTEVKRMLAIGAE
jgi:hypothetical protein